MPETPRVIVPVAVLEGEVIPDTLIEFLSVAPVIVLGYHRIPEQTLPEQAREEFGEQAERELERVVEAFEAYDAPVESRLVFTHDVPQTINHVVADIDRGVVLRPNPVQSIEDVIVAVRTPELVPAITATMATIVGPTTAGITVRYVANDEAGEQIRSGIETALREDGISAERITVTVEETSGIETLLTEALDGCDLVVLGEDDPGIFERLLAPTSEQIAERTLAPVLVVQRPFEGEA